MGKVTRITWDDLPLFASDQELGAAVVGPERADHWARVTVKNLERQSGFPKFDEAHGGRYTPAVRRFYEVMHDGRGNSVQVPGMPRAGQWADRRVKRTA
jgi:hypothetical protein